MNQLLQRFDYANDDTTLHCFSVVNGPNRLLEQLPAKASVAFHRPDPNGLVSALVPLLAESQMAFERTVEPASDDDKQKQESVSGADHVVRLWANDEVGRQLTLGRRDEAIRLGLKRRLVTPVTGAVVLETQAQYDAHGLTPVDPHEVPTIPEPEVWLMLIIGSAMIGFVSWKKRRARMVAA